MSDQRPGYKRKMELSLKDEGTIWRIIWGGNDKRNCEKDTLYGVCNDIRRGTALTKAGMALADELQANRQTLVQNQELLHKIREGDQDFPAEMIYDGKFVEAPFLGAHLSVCNHLDVVPTTSESTADRIFFVNAAGIDHNGGRMDPLLAKRLLSPLSYYDQYELSELDGRYGEGRYVACDAAEDRDAPLREANCKGLYLLGGASPDGGDTLARQNLAADLLLHCSAPHVMPGETMIIYVGHVSFDQGAPMLHIGDRKVPVERLLVLDPAPQLVMLMGCGPDDDQHMAEAARRLMLVRERKKKEDISGRVDLSSMGARNVIAAAYPVQFHSIIDLFGRLLTRMVDSRGAVTMADMLRDARFESLASGRAVVRDLLAFRFFGSDIYRPNLLAPPLLGPQPGPAPETATEPEVERRSVRGKVRIGLIAAALIVAAAVALGMLHCMTGVPKIGDVTVDRDGTLVAVVPRCPDELSLALFLHNEAGGGVFGKSAGMERQGDRFRFNWRAPGTHDDSATALTLFLYPVSEVKTIDAYALVKEASVDEKVLTELPK